MAGEKILVVDDEETLCEALKFNFEAEGYQADTAYSAEEALKLPLEEYDLVLLDVMMGQTSGFAMARQMKQDPRTASVPIIFCTALGDDDNMVAGLNLGGDDYIAKPYSLRTMMARVRSVLRRTSAAKGGQAQGQRQVVSYEGLVLDEALKSCTVDGEQVKMPRKEYKLLHLLMTHPGQIFSRQEIMDRVWDDDVVVSDRSVDVNITRVRQKIGPYGHHIITRSGYGYGFEC